MSNKLLKTYRTMYEQCFIPIFIKDDYDTETLLQGCRLAGINAIEYTLRRQDARDMIPNLKSRYGDLVVSVGSTLDSAKIVSKMSKQSPQLMTLDEIASCGVDGFVSMIPWSLRSINQFSKTHIVIPSGETLGECLMQMDAGAHFIKMSGMDLDFVKKCRAIPTFGFCPIFVTGGITLERIPFAFEAGAVLVASGFDVILSGISALGLTPETVCGRLLEFRESARSARNRKYPVLCDAKRLCDEEWLEILPHYHPF